MKPIIAVDGPAASGKGTLARMLAEHFHFAYLDSGRLYRAFACVELILADKPSSLLENCSSNASFSAPLSDIFEDQGFLSTLSAIFRVSDEQNKGIDLSSYISRSKFLSGMVKSGQDLIKIVDTIPDNIMKSEIVGMEASTLGKLPEVRVLLTSLMKDFAHFPGDEYLGTVMDGRDIGTAVFPDAACKIFVTADLKVRAERRFNDIKHFESVSFESVYEALKSRDERDATRGISPMKCDDTYVLFDTTDLSIQEAFDKLVKIVDTTLQNN